MMANARYLPAMETNMQNTFKPAGQAVADLVAGIKEPEDETPQRLPRFFGEHYGWDYPADVNWPMLQNNYVRGRFVLDNPQKFPRANVAHLEEEQEAIWLLASAHGRIDIL